MKRVFLIVLDSFGIGEMKDADAYGDKGTNTIGSVSTSSFFHVPNLKKLGLFNIEGVKCQNQEMEETPLAAIARMKEASKGKDTTIGHWEIAGMISENPLPTYPDGFPQDVLDEFMKLTGRGILCNKPYSGTEVIMDYGDEHVKTGNLIVYTSADSVFQVAAHGIPLFQCPDSFPCHLKGRSFPPAASQYNIPFSIPLPDPNLTILLH